MAMRCAGREAAGWLQQQRVQCCWWRSCCHNLSQIRHPRPAAAPPFSAAYELPIALPLTAFPPPYYSAHCLFPSSL
ncbi:unnamed protein product [Sphagnum troendelagicum]|uniref:Uncharacterized protein n=1 Tax=Sphagnum troendelagicum TaxID=128251 RepID=A0ABP0TJ05_9BRYO